MTKMRVSYTVTELVDFEIKDYTLTAAQIEEAVTSTMNSSFPDCSFEWVEAPKAKGSKNKPPDDFYFKTTSGLLIATNGHIAVTQDFPFPSGFTIGNAHWMEPSRAIAAIEKVLAIDFNSLPAHKGWFSQLFAPLLKLGLDVRGKNETSVGYLLLKGELVGALMPMEIHGPRRKKEFQFPVLISGESTNGPN